jgi:hypothetical protein
MQQADRPGRWRAVGLEQSCTNFYPSGDFKLGSAAVRRIPLTRGKFALVDAADYYRLARFPWFANGSATNTFYAIRNHNRKGLRMHRVIMNAPDHLFVDHIDRNGLNNCRSNLRLCTHGENSCNMSSYKGAASKYKGVCWYKKIKKWGAAIRRDGKQYYLGTFKSEIEAARAYDEMAKKLHGAFACLNLPVSAEMQKTQCSSVQLSKAGVSDSFRPITTNSGDDNW